MRAVVVGGGIGGVSAAIVLRRAGVEVEVYQRTRYQRTARVTLQSRRLGNAGQWTSPSRAGPGTQRGG